MRLKKNKANYFFHPYEVAICGFSNTGKTTLIAKIIKNLSKDIDIAYLKHDAHHFQMDRDGKDTQVMSDNGAKSILINDQTHYAFIDQYPLEQHQVQTLVLDKDALIIEGHKYSEIPKIVLLGEGDVREQTLKEITEGKITNVLATVSIEERNNTDLITKLVLDYFHSLIPQKIYGLVLTGGMSQRMKQDKGALNYHGMDQVSYSKNLLADHCDEVFVSCRNEQSGLEFINNHKVIIDEFPSQGPTSGLLTAMSKHPDATWLVLACDLPYLDQKTIAGLVSKRNPFKNATCYLNPEKNWPEPLCTLYEPKAYQRLMLFFAQGMPCPRKVLFNSNIKTLELENKLALNNVNTPDEYAQALSYLQGHGEIYAH